MDSFNASKWLKIAVFNLIFVAIAGCLMRYKILYSFPLLQQKHVLHSHSHFAFSGWISLAIMAFMIQFLSKRISIHSKKYQLFLKIHLLSSYGMLIAFAFQGYGFFSISFSTLSIITNLLFAIQYWKDLNRIEIKSVSSSWFKAALFFSVFSSIGAFSLAYLMANKIAHQNWYLLAIYFFLHFQYNGWFIFSCFGFINEKLEKAGSSKVVLIRVLKLFTFACIPAYFLSALWLNLPIWLFIIVIFASVAQLLGWIIFVKEIFTRKQYLTPLLINNSWFYFLLVLIAMSIKVLLQLGSTIPWLSTLAFGFRPIVIGYLHLVLLGIVTLFLLSNYLSNQDFEFKKSIQAGLNIFVLGFFLNEIILLIQGSSAIKYFSVPFANEGLLSASALMLLGISIIARGFIRSK